MKKETYEESMARLEQIVGEIERGELDIDQMCDALKEAQALIKTCHDKLHKTDEEIKKILESVK